MNAIKQLWKWLYLPSPRFPVAIIMAISLIASGGAIIAINIGLSKTNTMAFCAMSCHEMETAFEELQQTKHYINRVGIRAGCPDCHIPPEDSWQQYLSKFMAIKDVFGSIIGTIDTPDKYEASRLRMAEKVWDRMKATDSNECLNCHSLEAMHFGEQNKTAARKHQRAWKYQKQREEQHDVRYESSEYKTCIDCHKGIVHKLPQGVKD